MGRIAKLKRLTMARIEAFLASLERPEDVIAALVAEMTQKLAEAAKAQAKAATAVEADRRRVDAATGRAIRLEKGATVAIKSGEVDVARQAIAAQIKAEHDLTDCQNRLEVSESAMRSARDVRLQLQDNLQELKRHKKEILSRIRVAQAKQGLAAKHTTFPRDDDRSILDFVARMEADLEEEEARIEIHNHVERTLGLTFEQERVKEFEADEEVERRLNELKKQLKEEGCGL